MNIQEDEKKPVYEIHESVTITKQHFDWLNHEVLRIGHLARQYSDQGDLLRAELKLLRHERVHDLSQLGEAQAEVKRLEDFCTRTIIPNEILQSENERLRKAGDEMARHYLDASKIEWGQFTTYIPPSVVRWNAAKEGKPSI